MQTMQKKQKKNQKGKQKTPRTVHIQFTIVCTSELGNQQDSVESLRLVRS